MWETEVFHYWWLIPLILIALCFFMGRGCCFGRRTLLEDRPDRPAENNFYSALEILSKRYARGEIDDEEYERKSRIITQAKQAEPK